jgi:hypothetical protein
MKSILKLFSDHGTFVQPDALKYISLKENPDDFASFLIKNLREYPLFLTMDTIKDLECATQQLVETPVPAPLPPPSLSTPPLEKTNEKEHQKKKLSNKAKKKTKNPRKNPAKENQHSPSR